MLFRSQVHHSITLLIRKLKQKKPFHSTISPVRYGEASIGKIQYIKIIRVVVEVNMKTKNGYLADTSYYKDE